MKACIEKLTDPKLTRRLQAKKRMMWHTPKKLLLPFAGSFFLPKVIGLFRNPAFLLSIPKYLKNGKFGPTQ
jgi:hypothetical protein